MKKTKKVRSMIKINRKKKAKMMNRANIKYNYLKNKKSLLQDKLVKPNTFTTRKG